MPLPLPMMQRLAPWCLAARSRRSAAATRPAAASSAARRRAPAPTPPPPSRCSSRQSTQPCASESTTAAPAAPRQRQRGAAWPQRDNAAGARRSRGSARQCEPSEQASGHARFSRFVRSRKECVPRHAAAQYAPAAARGGRYITALSRTGSSAAASAARRAISLRLSSSTDAALATPASSAPNVWFCARCGGCDARAQRVVPAGAAQT